MNRFLGISLVTLWFQVAWAKSQWGEENLQALSIQEGEDVTMNCSYKTYTTVVQWYRQKSGKGPALIILIRSNEREKRSGRLRATLDTSSQSSSLSITGTLATDTAVYFCATD
ncbi:mCG142749, partial [Mus musculus]